MRSSRSRYSIERMGTSRASCSTTPRSARLDRLWDELHFISRDALTLVDAFAQLMEYASQDGDPKVFEPLRQPINERAEAFRRRLVEVEPPAGRPPCSTSPPGPTVAA